MKRRFGIPLSSAVLLSMLAAPTSALAAPEKNDAQAKLTVEQKEPEKKKPWYKRRTAKNVGVGAGAGTVVGAAVGGGKGAAAGAVVGSGAGYVYDRKTRDKKEEKK